MPKYFEDLGNDVLARLIKILDVDGMLPTDAQYRRADTVQTQNAVSIAANGNSIGSWIDCDGYSDVAVTLFNDAITNSRLIIHWSNDGITKHGSEIMLATGPDKERAAQVPTKARYFRMAIDNQDAGSAHTMSCWAYLKV